MPLKIWLCTFWIWILTTMLSICQHDKKHEWLFCKPHVLILRLYIRSWTFISTYSWGKEYIDPHLQSLLWLQEIIYYEEQVQSSLNQIPVTMKGLRGVMKTHLEAWTVQNITNRGRDWQNLSDFVVLSTAMHWESKKQQCHTLCLSSVSHVSTSCATQALFKKFWWFQTDGPIPWSRNLAWHRSAIPLGIRKPRTLNRFTISAENSRSDTSIANQGVVYDQISWCFQGVTLCCDDSWTYLMLPLCFFFLFNLKPMHCCLRLGHMSNFMVCVIHSSSCSFSITCASKYLRYQTKDWGHVVVQLVEALRYKLEGCGFDSRWCHLNFPST